MNDILNKISSYNLFNYLLPGVVFVILAERLLNYSLVQPSIVIGLFLYYFIGLVISRFGSLIVEPLLRRTSFLQFTDYNDFVAASKKDEKIELFSEVNNTYRTLCALFVLLAILKIGQMIENWIPALQHFNNTFSLVFLFVLFMFSYRKQTQYISKRVNANKLN